MQPAPAVELQQLAGLVLHCHQLLGLLNIVGVDETGHVFVGGRVGRVLEQG